jgi:hypothetical protein
VSHTNSKIIDGKLYIGNMEYIFPTLHIDWESILKKLKPYEK